MIDSCRPVFLHKTQNLVLIQGRVGLDFVAIVKFVKGWKWLLTFMFLSGNDRRGNGK